jgi:energy-coupling factor transport system permease protein
VSRAGSRASRLPRSLHPAAWWIWALGLAVAASRTTNPLLLAAILTVASWVVIARRSDAPWANAFRLYLLAGAVVVAMRIVFRIVFGSDQGGFVLVPLPSIPLPKLAAGIHLFGDVSAPSLLAGLYDGLRLATMLVCVGAANALANPRRLLRSMPSALHEVSTAVVVSMSVFPQLAESLIRVRRARRLRPDAGERRLRRLRAIAIPVLEDALDRSRSLASSMDARGYGRRAGRSRGRLRLTGALTLVGVAGIAVGVYGLLDGTTPRYLGTPTLVGGLGVGTSSLILASRGVRRTSYRPDRWRFPELVTVASGGGSGVLVYVTSRVDPANLNPSLQPLTWPSLSVPALLAILVAALPAVLTPPPAEYDSGAGETDVLTPRRPIGDRNNNKRPVAA